MTNPDPVRLAARLERLESHLAEENPVLLDAVRSFRTLDQVGHGLGRIPSGESYATRVPWWPMIAVLGTFSSGKSTFINSYIGQRIQQSGNQAVDDKFTVICFGADAEPRVLPGFALDADPRFPFYQMSYEIDRVAAGEGRRVDAYLQLKTCRSETLRGRILIDSPGFDADAQRTSTLRITDHIVDLSDLVLVFFDARHPEPGAMHDTLQHLVADTITRHDSNKFLYILNQIDNTAREDNPEEVFAAWQRALAQKGLTAGRFYRIYDKTAAVPIEDAEKRRRFEGKRDEDLAEIHGRMGRVEVDRAYRLVGVLEKLARSIEQDYVPLLTDAKQRWKRGVLWSDFAILGTTLVLFLLLTVYAGYWAGLSFSLPGAETFATYPSVLYLVFLAIALTAGYIHFTVRRLVAGVVMRRLERRVRTSEGLQDGLEQLRRAFAHNTRYFSPILWTTPLGWGPLARRRLAKVLADADAYVQRLNDSFANPSGRPEVAAEAPETRAPSPTIALEKSDSEPAGS